MRGAPLLIFGLLAGAAQAADLTGVGAPSGAVETHFEQRALDSYSLPVGQFTETRRPSLPLEGRLEERVLRVDDATITSLEALREVEARLLAAGYERIFDCATATCGGFDFRFNIHVVQAPEMEVDLADFRFLAVRRVDPQLRDFVSVLVSRVGSKLFLQLISVEEPKAEEVIETTSDLSAQLKQRLEQTGRSILDNVDFISGKSELSEGSDAMLEALAALMADDPNLNIAIVGHTDSVGDPAQNQKLSEARANTVVARLVEHFAVDANRLSAHGVGFLAPVAPNNTDEGRAANRRVEAVAL